MKLFLYWFSVIVLSSCAVPKGQSSDQKKGSLPPPNISCPEGGDCTFEVFNNSSLNLAYDDRGKLYPEVISGKQAVVKYHYKRKPVKNAMDSGYSEYVYLEFDPALEQVILKDKELQKVKMIFGRICYCKGAMGYFPINQGNLILFNKNGNLQLRTSFKVSKVPQIIEEIDEKIKYRQ